MRDFTAGHISTDEAAATARHAARRARQASSCEFVPGVSYRNLLIYRGGQTPPPFTADTRATPPHDLTDKSVLDDYPRGPGSDLLNQLMSDSVAVFADHPVNVARRRARQAAGHEHLAVGAGHAPALPPFAKIYGKRGAMITAVDLLRGLAALDRLAADRRARRDRLSRHRLRRQGALRRSRPWPTPTWSASTSKRTDEASHEGNAAAKIKALEEIDRHIVGPLHAALARQRRVSDSGHARPSHAAAHQDAQPRRRAVRDGRQRASRPTTAQTYDEPTAARSSLAFDEGWKLMRYFLGS